MRTVRGFGRLPASLSLLSLSRARLLHVSPAIGICDSLAKLILLRRAKIVQIDIIQQAFLDDLAQNLFFHSFGFRRQTE